MGFFEVMLDPANVFKKREGGMDWTGALDPGGTMLKEAIGSDKALKLADPVDIHYSDDNRLGIEKYEEEKDPSYMSESWYKGGEPNKYPQASSNFQTSQPAIERTGPTPGQLVGGSARSTQAALSRAEWNDYKKRFFPLEENLINRYDNASLRNQAMAENHNATNNAFNVDRGVQARRLSRYGTSLSADQQAAQNRENQVARVASLTDVRNLTRDAYADIDQQILSGSSASSSDAIRTGGQ